MIRLAGDVAGLEILDAGCESGPLTEALRAKDAVVSGFDLSPAVVELARERLGEDADGRSFICFLFFEPEAQAALNAARTDVRLVDRRTYRSHASPAPAW